MSPIGPARRAYLACRRVACSGFMPIVERDLRVCFFGIEGVFDTLHAGTDIAAGCTPVWTALSFAGAPPAHNGHNRRLLTGWAAAVPPVCQPGTASFRSVSLAGVEVAGPVGVALGVDPHPEGVFPLRVGRPVPRPVVAFGPERHELGEALMPAGLIRGLPCGCRPTPVPGRGRRCRRGAGCCRLLRAGGGRASARGTVRPARWPWFSGTCPGP